MFPCGDIYKGDNIYLRDRDFAKIIVRPITSRLRDHLILQDRHRVSEGAERNTTARPAVNGTRLLVRHVFGRARSIRTRVRARYRTFSTSFEASSRTSQPFVAIARHRASSSSSSSRLLTLRSSLRSLLPILPPSPLRPPPLSHTCAHVCPFRRASAVHILARTYRICVRGAHDRIQARAGPV